MIYPQRAGERVVIVVVVSSTRIYMAKYPFQLVQRRTTTSGLRVGTCLLEKGAPCANRAGLYPYEHDGNFIYDLKTDRIVRVKRGRGNADHSFYYQVVFIQYA